MMIPIMKAEDHHCWAFKFVGNVIIGKNRVRQL